jgi:hypothetical protein
MRCVFTVRVRERLGKETESASVADAADAIQVGVTTTRFCQSLLAFAFVTSFLTSP